MKQLARLGDTCGGTPIVTAASSVFVEGKPAAKVGSAVAPHGHGDHVHAPTVVTGIVSVLIEGQPAAHLGSKTTCVHKVETSATSVFGG
jgi:uncharacterized Zn-binding protein involved in type VI secretion